MVTYNSNGLSKHRFDHERVNAPRDRGPTRRGLGRLVVGGLAMGLTGVFSCRYAAWRSPTREPLVFSPPAEGGAIQLQGQVLLIDDDGITRALSARCTHLGCTVTVAEDGRSLICPCHGSEYDLDGTVRRGPAKHPLQPLEAEPLEDGSWRVASE